MIDNPNLIDLVSDEVGLPRSVRAFDIGLVDRAQHNLAPPDQVAGHLHAARSRIRNLQIDQASAQQRKAQSLVDTYNLGLEPVGSWCDIVAAQIAYHQRRIDSVDRNSDHVIHQVWLLGQHDLWLLATRLLLFARFHTGNGAGVLEIAHHLVSFVNDRRAQAEATRLIADLFLFAGLPDQVLSTYQEITPPPGHPIELVAAVAEFQLARFDLVLKRLDRFETENAQYREPCLTHQHRSLLLRARTLLALGRRQPAEAALELAADLAASGNSDHVRVNHQLARATIANGAGHHAEARAVLEQLDDEQLWPLERSTTARILADAAAAEEDWSTAYRYRRQQLDLYRAAELTALQRSELRRLLISHGFGTGTKDSIETRQRQLDEQLEERSRLTSRVAKDLRGPLSSITVAVDTLDGDNLETLPLLDAALLSLELEVASLTALDKVESADGSALKPVELSLSELVFSALKRVGPLLRSVVVDTSDVRELTAVTRPDLAGLVVNELFREVAQHMPKSSHLTVVVDERPGWREIRLLTELTKQPESRRKLQPGAPRDRFVVEQLAEAAGAHLIEESASATARRITLRFPA